MSPDHWRATRSGVAPNRRRVAARRLLLQAQETIYMRLLLVAAAAGVAYYYYRQRQLLNRPGSTTNASDAMDDIHVRSGAGTEEHLDAAVMETFPASDPVSSGKPSETAWEKQQRLKGN
jgi:hypothetical protein